MNEMKDIDEGAYVWLKGHITIVRARHMFKSDGLSDTVLNKMCERFNSRKLKFRGKPIISTATEKYINGCYKISTYTVCYEPMIDPINGQHMWILIGLPPMQPSIKRRPLGRRKKKRVLEPNELKRAHSKGLGIAKRCESCGKLGHNKRSYKCEVGENSSLPGGLNQRQSRPKKTIDKAHADGSSGGMTINEPNPIRVPAGNNPTKN
ncbi:hypothetical protein SO802_009737 [Lithocarpus litseifolius]|uniref:CCHC-type domain-containing protein n=1 Tax=Lithocarpus litseifolius TaxID=425828 RepID=A0AAW2DCA1_9ROSI